jgi:hypothetical protein
MTRNIKATETDCYTSNKYKTNKQTRSANNNGKINIFLAGLSSFKALRWTETYFMGIEGKMMMGPRDFPSLCFR